jgi:hypothetical protein
MGTALAPAYSCRAACLKLFEKRVENENAYLTRMEQ